MSATKKSSKLRLPSYLIHHRHNIEEHFEGRSQPSKKAYPLARGVALYRSDASARDERPHVGHKGAIYAGGGPKVVIREGITQRSVHSTI